MLTRKSHSSSNRQVDSAVVAAASPAAGGVLAATMDRRTFLKRSGLVAGGGAIATQLPYNMIGSAEAADAPLSTVKVRLPQREFAAGAR